MKDIYLTEIHYKSVTCVFTKRKLQEKEGYGGKVLYCKSISFIQQQGKNWSAILILLCLQQI